MKNSEKNNIVRGESYSSWWGKVTPQIRTEGSDLHRYFRRGNRAGFDKDAFRRAVGTACGSGVICLHNYMGHKSFFQCFSVFSVFLSPPVRKNSMGIIRWHCMSEHVAHS